VDQACIAVVHRHPDKRALFASEWLEDFAHCADFLCRLTRMLWALAAAFALCLAAAPIIRASVGPSHLLSTWPTLSCGACAMTCLSGVLS
jgi:hypothetical protein